MGRIIVALLAFVLVMAVIKMLIVALVVAGLIFRTKETLALLLVAAVVAGFMAHPLIGIALVAVLVPISLYFKRKEARQIAESEAPALPEPDI